MVKNVSAFLIKEQGQNMLSLQKLSKFFPISAGCCIVQNTSIQNVSLQCVRKQCCIAPYSPLLKQLHLIFVSAPELVLHAFSS